MLRETSCVAMRKNLTVGVGPGSPARFPVARAPVLSVPRLSAAGRKIPLRASRCGGCAEACGGSREAREQRASHMVRSDQKVTDALLAPEHVVPVPDGEQSIAYTWPVAGLNALTDATSPGASR